MTWKSTENYFVIYKKYWKKNPRQGGLHLSTRVGARLPPRHAPLAHGLPEAPLTSTPTLYIHVRGEKNQREGFITFYDTEPPPSPNLSREGWFGVRSGLWRVESIAIIIINLPPSPISWCSPPCLSNSIVGLLDGDGLDEIHLLSGKLILEHLWGQRTGPLSVRRGAEIARRADQGEAHKQFTQLRSSSER